MAKTMAVISDGVIENILWCDDTAAERTFTEKVFNPQDPERPLERTVLWADPQDRPVAPGDRYEDGKWYREDTEILTPLQKARNQLEALKAENADMASALEVMGVHP